MNKRRLAGLPDLPAPPPPPAPQPQPLFSAMDYTALDLSPGGSPRKP